MTGENDRGFGKTTAAKILRKRAKEKVAAGNKPFTDMSVSEMSTLIHELRIHQVELERKNEVLRKSQAEAERSRKAYQDLWELSPAGYLIVDAAGRVSAVNRDGRRLFSRPEDALLSERFATLVAPENQVPVHLMFERALETASVERQEIRILKPDGAVNICLLEVSALRDATGREQTQAVLTDITELKKADEALETSEEKFRKLYNETPVMMHSIDNMGKLIDVNNYWLENLGYKREEVIGKVVTEFLTEKSREYAVKIALPPFFEKGEIRNVSYQMVKNNGEIIDVLLSASSENIHEGKVTGALVVIEDITERKALEEALQHSEQEKTAILDSLVELVTYYDRKMKILWANEAACQSVHMTREELLNQNCHEVWANRRTPCEDCPVIKARETGQPQTIEKMTPDGRWWYIKGHPVKDKNGRVTGMTELTLDITERKRAEEAVRNAKDKLEIKIAERTAELIEANEKLRQEIEDRRQAEEELRMSEEKYRILVDNITIGVGLISTNMEVLAVNQQLRTWFPNIKIDQKPLCYQAFHDPPREGVCSFCQATKTFQDGQVHESLAEIPSGDEIGYFRVISTPVKDTAGKVVAGIEMVEDVTDRLRTQKALQESERRFRSIFDNAPIGFYRTTPDGRIMDANPALIQILGYASFEELATVNLVAHDYHPDYSPKQFKERIERDGQILGMESFWKRSDGTSVYIRENARAIRGSDGKVVCYEGTLEDISDQKQANDQVRILSQQLIQAQEDERQMISRELHDSIAQDLSSLLIGLDIFSDHQFNPIPEVQKKALELSEILEGTIGAVRNLSYELRPPGLDDMGLITALSMYCEEFAEKSGLKVEFQSTGMSGLRLDFDTEMNLYRLTQEGLNNIRKHAAASKATVKLIGIYPNIILRIEDDGQGFDVAERAHTTGSEKRMGLRSMAERVRLIQGKIKIQSQTRKGTKIFIKFPWQEKKDD